MVIATKESAESAFMCFEDVAAGKTSSDGDEAEFVRQFLLSARRVLPSERAVDRVRFDGVEESVARWADVHTLAFRKGMFRLVWNVLANEGACDGWGGAECRLVWYEYKAADCPGDVAAFIRERC